MDRMVVVIGGPESSGKSQLCSDLSSALNAPWVPEYARQYLETNGASYDWEVFQKIYFRHLQVQEEALDSLHSSLIILDTDSVNFMVWAQRVFKEAPPFILNQYPKETNYHYLQCFPDLPWEDDPLRENPNDREAIFNEQLEIINDLGRPVRIIKGQKKERLRNAIDALLDFELLPEDIRKRALEWRKD